MTKEERILHFNPNDPGSRDAQIFGLPFSCDEADVVIIPVPWEATVSYGSGTSAGPKAVFDASFQMDLNHYDYPDLWKRGIAMDEIPQEIMALSVGTRQVTEKILQAIEGGLDPGKDKTYSKDFKEVNDACEQMNQWVEERSQYWRKKGKIVGLLGGDHSTPLGFLRGLSKQHDSFGVLVVDAHMDLRKAYEGFTYSHASIFYNTLQLPAVANMVQVGIRDYCHEEDTRAQEEGDRVNVYFDKLLQREHMRGVPWAELIGFILAQLPDKVYVSVDIDGLDPVLCPNTGTPVPGGLQFEQLSFLLHQLGESGKQVIGFDLCEVSPGTDEWDGNVGARVLYQLCGMAASKSSKHQ